MRAPVRIFGLKVPGLSYDLSISDPAFAAMLHVAGFGLGAYSLYEALRNPAFYRGVSLISGTIASLPLCTYRKDSDSDENVPASSFLDEKPSGPYNLTPFAWKEAVALHLVTEGECGLRHIRTEGGALAGLWPVAPTSYTVGMDQETGRRYFNVQMANGTTQQLDDTEFSQILGMSLDGIRGISPVVLFQRGIQLATAMEIAAMRTMTNGMHIAGLVAPKDEDIGEDDAKIIKAGLDAKVSGPDNAGGLAMVNKRLVFTPWTQTNSDAQFLEGREFSVHDVARMLGVPAHLLYSNSKEQSFASGLSEQVTGLQRFTLMPYTSRIEGALSALLKPSTKFVEFDYKGLLAGTPENETKVLLEELAAGVISEEEVRAKLGYGPKDPTDTFHTPTPIGARGAPPLEELPAEQTGGQNGNGKMPMGAAK